jgi:hypothetical protein
MSEEQKASDGASNEIIITANHLTIGNQYTRVELRSLFGITDASINNGIFKPTNPSIMQ